MKWRILMILIGLSILIAGCAEEQIPVPDYIIEGDSVKWENEYGKIKVTPHTLRSPDGCYEIEATSYLSTQELDCAISANSGQATGKSAWIWANISHKVTKKNLTTVVTEYQCENNQTICYGTKPHIQYTTEDIYYYDWKNINNKFSKVTVNQKDLFVIDKIGWVQNTTKKVRICIDAPMRELPGGGWGVQEKLDIQCKKDSESWTDAISSGHLLIVDPWVELDCANYVSTHVTPQVTDANQLLDINVTRYINFNYAIAKNNDTNVTLPFFNHSFQEFYTNDSLTAAGEIGIDLYYNCSFATKIYDISNVTLKAWDYETVDEVGNFSNSAGDLGTPVLNTTHYYHGSASMGVTPAAAALLRNTFGTHTDYGNTTTIAYFYDDGDAIENSVTIECFGCTGNPTLRIGYYEDVNTTHYSYKNEAGTPLQFQSSIPRSVGWHEIKATVNGTGMIVLFDDILATVKNGVIGGRSHNYTDRVGMYSDAASSPVVEKDFYYIYRDYAGLNPILDVGDEISQSDATSPVSILTSPVNDTISNSNTISFVCNATDDTAMSNISLYFGTVSLSLNITNQTSGTINGTKFTVSGIADGNYIWNCKATDGGNNQAFNTSENRTFKVDTTIPDDITLLQPANNSDWLVNDLVFNITASDNIDTNLTCNITLDGAVNKTLGVRANGGAINSSSINISGIPEDNNHLWNVTCYDNANNSNTSATYKFSVKIPPVSILTLPANDTMSNSNTISFTCAATDDTALSNISLYFGTTSLSLNVTNSSSGTTDSTKFTVSGIADGNYIWNCKATDEENNQAFNTSENRTFKVDTIPPASILTSPVNDTISNSNTISFVCNATDDTAMSNISLYFGTTSLSLNATNSSSGTTDGTKFTIGGIADGDYIWNCKATDEGNNQAFNTSENRTFEVDATIPNDITLLQPANNSDWLVNNLVFNITASDNREVNLTCNITLDGAVNKTLGVRANGGAINSSSINISGIPENTNHLWNVTCYDYANNSNTSATYKFSVDTINPNINVTNYETKIITFLLPSTNTTINWTGTDVNIFNGWLSYSGVNYTADNDGAGNFGYNLSIASDGNNSIVLYVNDSYGRINSTTIWIYAYYFDVSITESKDVLLEGESNTLTLFINISNISTITDNTSAYLVWNNTDYGPGTRTLIASNSYRFVNNFTIPVDVNGSVTYYWNYTLAGIYNGTIEDNQTISPFTLSFDCTDGDNATVINFSVYEESSYLKFDNINFSSYFVVWLNDKTQNRTFNVNKNSVQNWTICMRPNNTLYLTDMVSEYKAEGYRLREYYLNNLTLNSTPGNSQLINLYVLSNTLGSNIDLYTYDLQDIAYPNRYVYAERYDISTGTYKLVAISKTDDDGHGVMPLELVNGLYRFVVKAYPNTIEFTSEPRKLTGSTLILRIAGTAFSDILDTFKGISYSLVYNTATTTFRSEYTTGGTAIEMCLHVYKHTISNHTQICQSCETSASGVLLCTIDNTTGDYFATLTAEINPLTLLESIAVRVAATAESFSSKFGSTNSYFVAIMIVGVTVLTATYSIVAAFVMLLVGFIAIIGFGLFTISGAGLFVLAIAIIFVIARLKR